MRLAVIDPNDEVLIAWPSTADAHADLADQFAAVLVPSRFRPRRRQKVAELIRQHILELQQQTIRL